MNTPSLESALARLPHARICVINGSASFTAEALLNKARALRSQWSNLRGARVSLCGLPPLELVITLIALDGHAAQILLLPPSLDRATCDDLNSQASTSFVLAPNNKDPQEFDIAQKAVNDPITTKWVLATSGTTGKPKLIEHQLATLTRTVRSDIDRGAEFVWGLLYDPNRFAGLQVVLQALFSGSTLVIPAQIQFDAQIEAILAEPVNALSATPSLWRKLLMDGRIFNLPLRQLTLGGEIADQSILDALKSRFPKARVIHIYASTEAGSGFAVQDGIAGFPKSWLNDESRSPGLRISDSQHLLIKPPLIPEGPEIRARLDSSGYLDTQDLVRIDKDRVLFVGRASGAINVGGNKVNPETLENYLRSIDGVVDARVFAKKSSMMGQLVAVEIVPELKLDTKSLRLHIMKCCKQDLESWEIPAFVTFTSTLKENAAGKRERISS